MEFMVFLLGLLVLMFIVEKAINKILGIKKKKISETSGKNLERWGGGAILGIFLIALWFVLDKDSDVLTELFWMTYITVSLGLQAVLEFIFLKEPKQYIGTIVLLVTALIVMFRIDKGLYFL